MSIYDNNTKIYPHLNPSAPQEPQTYRLKKLTKMKRYNTIPGIIDTGLITSTVITGGIYIAVFGSCVGPPVGIALGETSLLLSLAAAIT